MGWRPEALMRQRIAHSLAVLICARRGALETASAGIDALYQHSLKKGQRLAVLVLLLVLVVSDSQKD